MLVGCLENPRIRCMKQLFNKATNSEIISLAVKKSDELQKFQLPFKNLSDYQVASLEYSFIDIGDS